MPLLDYTKLTGYKEFTLAHVVLAFLSSGYVWQHGEEHVPKVSAFLFVNLLVCSFIQMYAVCLGL